MICWVQEGGWVTQLALQRYIANGFILRTLLCKRIPESMLVDTLCIPCRCIASSRVFDGDKNATIRMS